MIVIILPDIALEDRLLARAQRGDQDAIRQIYEAYFGPIYHFIRLRVDDRGMAEDLASEVFLKMVAAFKGASAPRQSLRGWLFRVARNVLHDHYGRRDRLSETALDEFLPAPGDETQEIQFMRSLEIERARQALQRLSFEQQEVILLRFGQMLSLQETADIMGKKINAVKALQFRAVNALRRHLAAMGLEGLHG